MNRDQLITSIREEVAKSGNVKFMIPKDLPLPVKYDGMAYFWGEGGKMVADFDAGVNEGDGFRIRGWGRVQDEESQDDCARYIERAVNEYSKVSLADVLLAIGKVTTYECNNEFGMPFRIFTPNSKYQQSGIKWDLSKSLEEQDTLTLEAVWKLLGNGK